MEGLIDTRNEYIEHIQDVITIPLSKRIYEIWRECSKMKGSIKEFQKELVQIKKWNNNIIYEEYKKIVKTTKCKYLADLIKNIIIITIKIKIYEYKDEFNNIKIKIPLPEDFIHKCYINVARKIYKNVYLFELNCPPLQIQKHSRELETIVQECILNAVRESIPVENILRAYMDETVEEDVIEEIKEQIIEKPETKAETQAIFEGKDGNVSLKFNDVDSVMTKNGKEELVEAPKTIERLEEISALRNMQRKMEEEDDDEKLKISNEDVSLDILDVHTINPPEVKLDTDFLLDDIEILS